MVDFLGLLMASSWLPACKTGVARKRPILDLALCAGTDANHFGDINEMVGDRVAAIDAGLARLGDDGDEVTEVGVFEHAGKFAGGPEFTTVRADPLDALESVAGGGDGQLIAHGLPFTSSHASDEDRNEIAKR